MRSRAPKPDAAIWPKDTKGLPDPRGMEAQVEIAERLLEIDLSSTELAWIRDQVSYWFATTEREESLCSEFVLDVAGIKRPRYRWEARDGGEKVGWLADL